MKNIMKYEKYKNSGIDWIGEIPEHWEVRKSKYTYKEIKEFSKEGKELLLSVSEYYGVAPRKNKIKENFNLTNAESLAGHKICKKNDLVMNIMLAWKRGLGVSKWDGIVSPAYSVFRGRSNKIAPFFSHYLLRTDIYTSEFKRNSTGIIDSRLRLYPDSFDQISILLPPLSEQRQIADFLDKKTALIDSFISKKKRLIKLFNKQKKGIITKAVTKGINPNAKMKNSGVEWIGEIPEHWEVRKLKYLLSDKLKYGANESAELDDINLPRYIRITDFSNNGKLRNDTFKSLNLEIAKNYFLEKGDILFARSGATVGKTFKFDGNSKTACFAGYLIKATPKKQLILSDFIYNYTKSFLYDTWKVSIFSQSTIQNISAEKYAFLSIAFPSLSEQTKIVEYIETKLLKIDNVISKTEKEIELMKKYRKALISEVVTGKIKVTG